MRRERPRLGLFIDLPPASLYQKALVEGADARAASEGADLFVFAAGRLPKADDAEPALGAEFLKLLKGGYLDAAIVQPTSLCIDSGVKVLESIVADASIPVVSVGAGLLNYPSVRVGGTDGFAELLRHLFLDHGFKRPAFISGPLTTDEGRERFGAYFSTARACGVEPDIEAVFMGNFDTPCGELAIRDIWDQKGLSPDVIVSANDAMAIAAIRALRRRGVSAPGELIVTGYDDLELRPGYRPPFSSVRQPVRRMSSEAVGMALEWLSTGKKPDPVLFPTEAIIRCDSARAKHESAVNMDELVLDAHFEAEAQRGFEMALDRFCSGAIMEGFAYASAGMVEEVATAAGLSELYLIEGEGFGEPESTGRCVLSYWGGKARSREGGWPLTDWRDILPDAAIPGLRHSLIFEFIASGGVRHGMYAASLDAATYAIYDMIRSRLGMVYESRRASRDLASLREELAQAKAAIERLSRGKPLEDHRGD